MNTRTRRFARQALYDLVWSEPRTHLAKRLGLSDVGISKACRRALIPMPEPGYWAKKRAGKRTRQPPLPLRGPGMSEEVRFGGNHYWYDDELSPAAIKASNPSPPEFDEPLESLIERVRQLVGKVTVPRGLARPHRVIARLLEEDEHRHERQRVSTYPMSWNEPKFATPIEKRRLRIINALYLCLERCLMKPSVRGESASELSVLVGQQNVRFTLEPVSAPPRKVSGSAGKVQKARQHRLRFQISSGGYSREAEEVWEDTDTESLERQLTDVAVALIVAGERQYRAGVQHRHDWLIQRRTELEEEERRQRAEQVRLEQERRQQREQAWVDRLLADASALRQAGEIRNYVGCVVNLQTQAHAELPSVQLDTWVSWALAQADRIDPIQSRRFIKAMKDPAED